MINLTKRQWLTLTAISLTNCCISACLSIEAPFYPKVAAQKGCSASEFGFVFAILELVIFITAPIIGHYLNRMGIRLTLFIGLYIMGVFSILFGLVNYINGHILFLSISLVIRVIEALGFGAVLTATGAIIAQEFPDDVGTATAICDLVTSVGLILGTTGGGALIELGGYSTPFAVYGVSVCIVTTCSIFILPKTENSSNLSNSNESDYSIMKAIKIPGVVLALIASIVTTMAVGFLQTTLEPYTAQFHLRPFTLGLVFIIPRIIYFLTILIFGRICDKYVSPKIVVICGAIFQCIGFCLIGPAPFIRLKPSLILVIVGLVFHGFGITTQLIGTFVDTLQTTLAAGFENNTKTNGLVAGVWTSTCSLGQFIGPSIGGILFDKIGFRNACMFIFGTQFLIATVLLFYVCKKKAVIPYGTLRNENPIQTINATLESNSPSLHNSENIISQEIPKF